MSVTTVKDRLATLCGNTYIAGIKAVYQGGPRIVIGANLPAMIILTGPSEYTSIAEDVGAELRLYRLALVVKPWAEGIDLEAEALCEPFFERVRACFDERPFLQLDDLTTCLAGVQNAMLLRDSGITNVVIGGQEQAFSGVIFDLQVEAYVAKPGD